MSYANNIDGYWTDWRGTNKRDLTEPDWTDDYIPDDDATIKALKEMYDHIGAAMGAHYHATEHADMRCTDQLDTLGDWLLEAKRRVLHIITLHDRRYRSALTRNNLGQAMFAVEMEIIQSGRDNDDTDNADAGTL